MSSLLRSKWLSRYAAFVLGFMVLVILEGAIVRATGSGAGCGNHWPLCNGLFFPFEHPTIATLIEYTHRSMTGILSTAVVGLIVWVFVARAAGDRVRSAVVWVGVLLVTEALLGAVLVKGGYVEQNASTMRVVMQCVHFTNTMLLVAALALTWWWLREESIPQGLKPQPSSKLMRREAEASGYLDAKANARSDGLGYLDAKANVVAWMAVVATLVVGASGSVAALADTLFPSPSLGAALLQDFSADAPLIVRMRWVHPAAAVVGVLLVGWMCWRVRSRAAGWLVGLMVLQMVLGVGDVVLLAPAWMQVLHLLGADLYWVALVVVAGDVVWGKTVASGA